MLPLLIEVSSVGGQTKTKALITFSTPAAMLLASLSLSLGQKQDEQE
jgi:hypothetical protein